MHIWVINKKENIKNNGERYWTLSFKKEFYIARWNWLMNVINGQQIWSKENFYVQK